MNHCITVSGLTKTVSTADGPLTLLKEINLKVTEGEALVITGESGSGKTTLLGLMAGLDVAEQGEIQLFGESLFDKTEEQRASVRRNRVGFVFQSFHLVTGATALNNVQLPLELLQQKNPQQTATDALQQVGLEHKLNTPVEHLSGGEQQRVAIARAWAIQPQILFADEPTGNLDSSTGEQITDLLFDLRNRHGSTLVLVTHETRLAQRGDREIRMSAGQITGEH